jgi:hypothetical protein
LYTVFALGSPFHAFSPPSPHSHLYHPHPSSSTCSTLK